MLKISLPYPMYWLVLTLVALVCAHVYLRVRCRRARKLLSHLPTYATVPFVGNMHKFFGDGLNAFRYLNEISDIIEETKMPFVVWIGYHCFIILSDPEEARLVANTFLEKPYFYGFARPWLRDGLITAPGSVWKRNVKILASAFNSATVEGFMPIFNRQAQKLLSKLKKETCSEPFDLLDKYLAYTTLETICQTALGQPEITKDMVTEDYYEAFNRTVTLIFKRSLNIFLHPEPVYRLTPAYREMKRSVKILHGLSDAILVQKRKKIEDIKIKEIEKKETEKVEFKCFLDMLMEASKSDTLSEERMKAEVDTIIVAGQETVATVLNYVFLMLGCKPDVQRKLYEEIKQVFGECNGPVSKEHLVRLHYCEAVICETLRLLPPVPAVLRRAHRDLALKSCTIPEGATCCINIWGAGRSRQLWGDTAAQYRPERWLSVNSTLAPPLLNFSTGRRACIGKQYAMCLMKTIIVYCVREMEFTSQADKMALKVDIAVRPVSGHLVQVRARNGDKQTCQTI
ncbi:cytochrome P450 4c21-like [Battus philenor]|uniref:cytochrome P450 4c21-like n=1 Tax=Battus philenor TaxID=42288 RepID=UPI0035CF059D